MARNLIFWLLSAIFSFTWAQQPPPKDTPKTQQPPVPVEQDPPEEDDALKPRIYTFNPLQSAKEMRIGEFYWKKHNFKAAAHRFNEATHWDPNNADGFLRLAESDEKLHDPKGARDAYAKYLELSPEAKNAESIRKKVAKR